MNLDGNVRNPSRLSTNVGATLAVAQPKMRRRKRGGGTRRRGPKYAKLCLIAVEMENDFREFFHGCIE